MSADALRSRTPLLVLVALLGVACDVAAPEAPAAPLSREDALAGIERLAARFAAAEDVSNPEFQAALDPFRGTMLKDWSAGELTRATASLHRLRIALVERYDLSVPYCADDSALALETCDDSSRCLPVAQIIELRCLWYASMRD